MSKIQWTEVTWNPTIGCSEVSPGCTHCYAAKMAYRLSHIPAMAEDYKGLTKKLANGRIVWTGLVKTLQNRLTYPSTLKKPTVLFVDSMSDLFHEDIPFEFINAVFSVMSDIDQHIYQVLTKRPDRALEFFKWKHDQFNIPWRPKDNVWIGVSVENPKAADERIPILLEIHAAVRFLSCEPLLGPLDLNDYLYTRYIMGGNRHMYNKIDWVIVGGESGQGARPMHPDWARSLRDQCGAAGVPFFFKQWGGVNKKKTGRLLEGKEYNEYPIALPEKENV